MPQLLKITQNNPVYSKCELESWEYSYPRKCHGSYRSDELIEIGKNLIKDRCQWIDKATPSLYCDTIDRSVAGSTKFWVLKISVLPFKSNTFEEVFVNFLP